MGELEGGFRFICGFCGEVGVPECHGYCMRCGRPQTRCECRRAAPSADGGPKDFLGRTANEIASDAFLRGERRGLEEAAAYLACFAQKLADEGWVIKALGVGEAVDALRGRARAAATDGGNGVNSCPHGWPKWNCEFCKESTLETDEP